MISAGQARSGRFTVTPRRDEDFLVLHVYGDLDVLTAPTLGTHLDVAFTTSPPVLIVDITDVSFLSSAGISLLVETHRLTERGGISLRVVADGPATSRVLRMMRIDEVIDLYPTLAEARQGRQV
ncbi:STAS domain-containing protein [Mycolicibacterium sp. BiH015]|uniref:STAS domain-containing protein n=1 Tax=Mycolicibacterium sp. BiH015 TaxID=3018808 RepID=UPI0022E610D3|nr:STAS domain-containing protein [Mycolicibacterium sp. BiH015]MDA2894750.1 STAS domain-containing protein [Mycolicibacterium sp. BiH015]